jgi:heme iron utilization protein
MSENGKLARAALRRGRTGSFATLDPEHGGPYVALANYACDGSGYPIFLFSRLARHTQGLLADARASLLVAEPATTGDALTGFRATFMGCAEQVAAEAVLQAYLAAHPYAAEYAGFGDFGFWRLMPETIHVVGGFGRIATLRASEVF